MSSTEIISFNERTNKDGRYACNGLVRVNDTIFKYSVTEQKCLQRNLRGSVSAVREDGKTAVRIKHVYGERVEVPIKAAVHPRLKKRDEIEKDVKRTAEKLFAKNIRVFEDAAGIRKSPDMITVIGAVDIHGARFVSEVHDRAKEETRNRYLNNLKKISKMLPYKPMCEISKAEIKKTFRKNKTSKKDILELFKFWEYCLNKRIIFGSNPIERTKRKRKTPREIKAKACRRDCLINKQEDQLYDILRNMKNGISCAIALMIGCGLNPEKIEDLRWKDIIIRNNEDYVVVRLTCNYAGASTHDYSRPIAPQAAEILIRRYQYLVDTYKSKKRIADMPVASMSRNPNKPIDKNRIVQEAKSILISNFMRREDYSLLKNEDLDISAATRVLRQTYKNDLIGKCSLEADPGLLKFLLLESLGRDVTADSYTSYTSPEAERRIYEIFKCLSKEEEITVSDNCSVNGVNKVIFAPKTNRKYSHGYLEVELSPGEQITLVSKHGNEVKVIVEKEE